jgi:lysine-N-methylase
VYGRPYGRSGLRTKATCYAQSVSKPVKRLQPRSYHAFRCIGAACEDTCCVGWAVNVDKLTYEAYQRCDHPELGPRLRELVTIVTADAHDDNHARIALSGPACPFLSEGLCAIQTKLGADHLSIMCAMYPRVMNVVDDVLQRSLDLSCPEAARLVLLDPEPMVFDEDEGVPHDPRLGQLSILSTSNGNSGKPYQYFREIRALVIALLQYRAYPLWKRLTMLGSLCDQLHASAASGAHSQIPEVLEAYRDAAARDLFGEVLINHSAQLVKQLEMVLEMIVGRIGSDFTAPRFLACYQEFMQGMQWTAESSMDALGARYLAVFAEHYQPFMREHEYMLEHYLVSYVHRTLFPLGPQESSRGLSAPSSARSIRDQCLLMLVHYGIIQTMLIGVAGLHQGGFGSEQVVKVIQSFAKTFEHSLVFPEQALKTLADHKIETSAGLAILLRN